MRLLVRMVLPFESYEGSQLFECLAKRVIRAEDDPECADAVLVDVDLPERYSGFAIARYWNRDGTYRVEALVKHNRRSLAAFIASGDHEWDLRNDEL